MGSSDLASIESTFGRRVNGVLLFSCFFSEKIKGEFESFSSKNENLYPVYQSYLYDNVSICARTKRNGEGRKICVVSTGSRSKAWTAHWGKACYVRALGLLSRSKENVCGNAPTCHFWNTDEYSLPLVLLSCIRCFAIYGTEKRRCISMSSHKMISSVDWKNCLGCWRKNCFWLLFQRFCFCLLVVKCFKRNHNLFKKEVCKSSLTSRSSNKTGQR